jgi:uncharacterized protein (TIGR00369 family)
MIKFALPILHLVRPSMVYDIVRKRLAEVVPFNTFLGIEVVSLADGVAEARLPLRREVMNHIETMHAAATFALAEAASGAAMSGAFVADILSVRPVATGATIEFLKTAKTSVTARAKTLEVPEVLRARLKADGKVVFDVVVDVSDEAGVVFSRVKVGWHVSQKR